jgi:hypothetical protein
LSNNTIKIVDAADLELVSEIAGMQSLTTSPEPGLSKTGKLRFVIPSSAAAIQPRRGHLYTTGPGLSTGTLQGYEIGLDHQVVRLDIGTLSRLKSVGTDRKKVFEPKIVFIAFAADASWLATVDEWEDKYTASGETVKEIALKFWEWKSKQWIIVGRIESPHTINADVIGLASPTLDSTPHEFSTLGSDGSIKIWRPFKRVTRDSESSVWSLHQVIGPSTSRQQIRGALKYSEDDSLLIGALDSTIYGIDVSTGQIVICLQVGHSISQMEILGRYVLCTHPERGLFSGWDITTKQMVFTERVDRIHFTIAVNRSSNTFALASVDSSAASAITISRITHSGKIDKAKFSLENIAFVVLGIDLPTFSGFIFLDELSQIGYIGCQEPQALIVPEEVKATRFSLPRLGPPEKGGASNIPDQSKNISSKSLHSIAHMDENLDIIDMYEKMIQMMY